MVIITIIEDIIFLQSLWKAFFFINITNIALHSYRYEILLKVPITTRYFKKRHIFCYSLAKLYIVDINDYYKYRYLCITIVYRYIV